MTDQTAFKFRDLAPERPREIVTETSEQFTDLMARAQREELFIESLSVGKTNAEWVAVVRWK